MQADEKQRVLEEKRAIRAKVYNSGCPTVFKVPCELAGWGVWYEVGGGGCCELFDDNWPPCAIRWFCGELRG